MADGVGQASIESFSPNKIVVAVTGAQAGEHVILNQNWDAGWRADGAPAMNWSDLVAAQIHGPAAHVVFRYRPDTLYAGLGVFVLTSGAIAFAWATKRRWPTAASSPTT
jgi:hypothetical protein